MDDKRIIRTYIKNRLEKYGFHYSRYDGNAFLYNKKINVDNMDITLTVSLYMYRFEKKMISFNLFTDVPGTRVVNAVNIEGITFNSEMFGFWKYSDEESLIAVLNQILDIVIHRGFPIFDDLSKKPKMIVTEKMNIDLYYNHNKLAEQFKNKYELDDSSIDEKHIISWFYAVEKCKDDLENNNCGEEEIQTELLKIAAFLGVQLERFLDGKWKLKEFDSGKVCYISEINSYGETDVNIIKCLIGGFLHHGIEWTKNIYYEIWNTRIPPMVVLTNEMVDNLYCNHTLLCNLFKKKYALDDSNLDKGHIIEWFDVIKNRIGEFRYRDDNLWIEEFISMVAFLGVQIEIHLNGQWKLVNSNGKKVCKIVNINSRRINELDILELLLKEYKGEIDSEIYFVMLVS